MAKDGSKVAKEKKGAASKAETSANEAVATEEIDSNMFALLTAHKRLKKLIKKQAAIAELENKDRATLKKEQLEMLENRNEVENDIGKYEQIIKYLNEVMKENNGYLQGFTPEIVNFSILFEVAKLSQGVEEGKVDLNIPSLLQDICDKVNHPKGLSIMDRLAERVNTIITFIASESALQAAKELMEEVETKGEENLFKAAKKSSSVQIPAAVISRPIEHKPTPAVQPVVATSEQPASTPSKPLYRPKGESTKAADVQVKEEAKPAESIPVKKELIEQPKKQAETVHETKVNSKVIQEKHQEKTEVASKPAESHYVAKQQQASTSTAATTAGVKQESQAAKSQPEPAVTKAPVEVPSAKEYKSKEEPKHHYEEKKPKYEVKRKQPEQNQNTEAHNTSNQSEAKKPVEGKQAEAQKEKVSTTEQNQQDRKEYVHRHEQKPREEYYPEGAGNDEKPYYRPAGNYTRGQNRNGQNYYPRQNYDDNRNRGNYEDQNRTQKNYKPRQYEVDHRKPRVDDDSSLEKTPEKVAKAIHRK